MMSPSPWVGGKGMYPVDPPSCIMVTFER